LFTKPLPVTVAVTVAKFGVVELMLIVALFTPIVVGLYFTVIVALPPTAIVLLDETPVNTVFEEPMLETAIGILPVLNTVNVCVDESLTNTFP
jgi:hypothetical protein